MLHYNLGLDDVLGLTPEQTEFLFAGLNWWGVVRMVDTEAGKKAKWDRLRMVIGSGDG